MKAESLVRYIDDKIYEDKSTLTFLNLYRSAMKVRNNKPFPNCDVKLLKTNPQVGVKSLLCIGEARGTSLYPVYMVFYDVEYSDVKDQWHTVRVAPSTDVEYWMKPIDGAKNPVRVYCGCTDFRFSYEYYNHKRNALFPAKKPTPYTRKTTTRPEKNPEHLPGICKHLNEFAGLLHMRGIIK
jgi:hypothetical protein